ncbi:MAG TPA: hypothetical protein VE890_13030 [Thermoguttaceae bacterium]|nr:hypothetical protein [Thermoguttaceae bacterium]
MKNSPATKEEAAAMMRTSALPSYDDSTVGEILTRMIDKPPKPLPEIFIKRLAVTAVEEPVSLGRVIRHALLESRGGTHAR